MKIVALLTGRGNNTLKNKNILDILGNPVLYYPANSAIKCDLIDNYYCSSDDVKILNYAKEYGYTPIKRPDELALPTALHIDTIKHSLNLMIEEGNKPDILVVLLANNVTIKSDWINKCIEMMQNDMSISAVVPIYKDNDHHPLRAKVLDGNNRLQCYQNDIDENISTNRQDLPNCYFLAHNFWVLNTEILLNQTQTGQPPWNFMGNNIAYLEISESIDIHNEIDLYLAKEWIKNNYID